MSCRVKGGAPRFCGAPHRSAGSGLVDGPLTIDLDSTFCKIYGTSKQGTRRHCYTGQWGYYPLRPLPLAPATCC